MIDRENPKDDIRFIVPLEPQTFSHPFSIAWESRPGLDIAESTLLVGTSDDNWDIMSANMGTRNRAAVDISDMNPQPERIIARLRYAVYDPDHHKANEKAGENKWYITLVPLEIHNKEFGTK
jgi:hypothetical protein